MRVCKFGGAAMRDAETVRRVGQIVRAEPERQIVVVSAPGRRDGRDEKVTDLMYACQSAAESGRAFSHLFDRVAERFRGIAEGLGLPVPDGDLRAVYAGLRQGASAAWAASRGEWLAARLLAAYLDWPFVDAAEAIRFGADGAPRREETARLLAGRLRFPCVLPGFYGADAAGNAHTFARGGSDVTAALAAAALNADACENWKDVRGVFSADPALVPDARCVDELNYRELRALSLMGAQVLCEDAVAPLRQAGVALNVRSFEEPEHPGTWVRPAFGAERRAGAIGVTGRAGLTLWRLERLGCGPRLARAALAAGLPMERLAVDADALCLALRGCETLPDALQGAAERALRQERAASLSVVGEGLRRADAPARLIAALSGAGISPLSLHMPPDALYLTAVIPEEALQKGVQAAYDAFLRL